MSCNHYREQIVDVACGTPAAPELESHLASCAECTEVLAGMRQTMSLLDEWQVPEPSPYFDVRLQARLREEKAQQRSWLDWFRKPALAAAATLLVGGAIALFQAGPSLKDTQVALNPQNQIQRAQTGTAVGDLQYLDKNSDLLSDFEALDTLDSEPSPDVN